MLVVLNVVDVYNGTARASQDRHQRDNMTRVGNPPAPGRCETGKVNSSRILPLLWGSGLEVKC